MDANRINTGVQQKNDEFTWFKPTANVHVEGYKMTAPDYSIPPTPASSYSNLHVVLDSVHPSTETITHAVLPSNTQYGSFRNLPSFLPSAPVSNPSISIPVTSSFERTSSPVAPRGLDAYAPLQPEIAPIQTPLVPLDEFDDLAERTDRDLPDQVDLSLVDETEKTHTQWNQVSDDIRHKNWNLHHQGPQRDVKLAGLWKNVGSDISNKNWNLKKSAPMRDAKLASIWKGVGGDIVKKGWNLRRTVPLSFDLKSWAMTRSLEENERKWRSTRGINGVWSGRINRVHHELHSIVPLGWAQWFMNLKNKSADKAAVLLTAVSDAAPSIETAKDIVSDITETLSDKAASLIDSASAVKAAAVDAVEKMTAAPIASYNKEWTNNSDAYTWSFPRLAPSDIIALEEAERAERVARGINPVVSGMWHKLGREMLHSYKDDIAAMFSGLRMQMKNKGSEIVDSALNKIRNMNTYKAPAWTAYPHGSNFFYKKIDFTFARDISQLASIEEERSRQVAQGINPILSGKWHRIGLELKHKFSLRPTLASTANSIVRVASDMANKATELIGDLTSTVSEKSKELLETPAPAEFESGHLNLYHFTAEPVDFTFKSQRCPKEILALEEKERSERIANGVDVVAYSRWNNLLSQPHKTLAFGLIPETIEAVEARAVPVLSAAKDTVVQSSKGMFGMLNSLAHSVVDKAATYIDAASHSQLAETAMDKYHSYMDASSIASINAAEEAERLRRQSAKVDPLMAARLGRVQDELLHSIKSV